jgi:hypothetical protein
LETGALGMVPRFIPDVGPWVALILPTLLAPAISPHWTVPLLTIALFGGLELDYRLLTPGDRDEWEFVDAYLKHYRRTALYDSVFLPVLSTVEADARVDVLDDTQRRNVEESMGDIIEELRTTALPRVSSRSIFPACIP